MRIYPLEHTTLLLEFHVFLFVCRSSSLKKHSLPFPLLEPQRSLDRIERLENGLVFFPLV